MEMLDGTIIATALPQMAHSFGESPVNVGIGISAYLLTLAVFIPASGWVADRFGARVVFAAAIVVFTVASALCGVASSLLSFTLARVLQGIGGAMMVPVGRLVVLRSTEKRDLIRATAFITTPGLVATVIGPPVGGIITTYASWRWMFFINIPLGVLGLALVLAFMAPQAPQQRRPFDLAGFVLSGSSLAVLMYGLDLIGRGDANVGLACAFVATGVVLGVLTLRHQLRAKFPLLDLSLLRIPTFATAVVTGGMCLRLVIGTTPFLWGLLFQVGFGMTAFAAGLLILACAVGDVATKSVTSGAVRRLGFRRLLSRNGLLIAAGMFACALLSPRLPALAIAALLFAIGVARSLQFTGINTLAYADVPPERLSAATSLASTAQQLSFGIGVAFSAMILQLAALTHPGSPHRFMLGDFRVAFLTLGLVALVSAASFARLPAGAGHAVSGHHG
jgi:EmrB/QacA subfamily drug resistance transporter